MGRFHEDSINSTPRIIGYVISVLFSIQIVLAGVMKLASAQPVVENMNAIPNWGDKILMLGLLELSLPILYWIPKTQKLGFYLLCSYMGGVIVAEVVTGVVPVIGIVTSVLLYAGTFLRKPSLIS